MKELDVVRLKEPNIELGITTDFTGTIVDVHVPGKVFTVEFLDADHNTIERSLFTEFTADQLELVWSPEENFGCLEEMVQRAALAAIKNSR